MVCLRSTSPQFRIPQALNKERKQTREEKDPAGAFCMTSNLYIDFIYGPQLQQQRPKGEGVGRPLRFPVKIVGESSDPGHHF